MNVERWIAWALVEVQRGRSLSDVVRRLKCLHLMSANAVNSVREQRDLDSEAAAVAARLRILHQRRLRRAA